MDEFTIGYIMGLIVGEGSFTHHGEHPVLVVKLHSDDPLPIQTLQEHLGGRVHGPYCYRGKDRTLHRFNQWYLTGSALRSQIPFLYKHLPPSKKREQFEIWMDRYGLYAYVIMEMLKQQ